MVTVTERNELITEPAFRFAVTSAEGLSCSLTTSCGEESHYYYGVRYLDPTAARWMTPDQGLENYLPETPTNDQIRARNEHLPGMGGVFNMFDLDLYCYAANNPVIYKDPNGLDPARTNTDNPNLIPVAPNRPAIVVVYSGERNNVQAVTGTAYVFAASSVTTIGNSAYVDLRDPSAVTLPIVSGGGLPGMTAAPPAPAGTYANVPTIYSNQTSPDAAAILTNALHGGPNSTVMVLPGTNGDLIHQGNILASQQTAFTEGCIAIVGQPVTPGEYIDATSNSAAANKAKLDTAINGSPATVVIMGALPVNAEPPKRSKESQ